VNVLIVDDHPIVVSGFKALLEADPAIAVMAAATAGAAQDACAVLAPDVAVIDINLPGVSGFDLAAHLIEAHSGTRIVMFSMNDDPVFIARAMEIGAKGFVSKNDNPANVLKAIHEVAAGGSFWPPGSAERVAFLGQKSHASGAAALSGREHEILRQLAKGRSLSEIAELVGVSYKTVAMSCAQLRTRFGARTQAELIAIAVDRKLV
jgi:two-component system, NarL family, invasion response regulator UvrY